jgi:hypothetical protein
MNLSTAPVLHPTDVFQKPQATAEDQDFRGHQREGGADSNLDSIDCHALAAVAETKGSLRLVAIQSVGSAAPAVVCLSGVV